MSHQHLLMCFCCLIYNNFSLSIFFFQHRVIRFLFVDIFHQILIMSHTNKQHNNINIRYFWCSHWEIAIRLNPCNFSLSFFSIDIFCFLKIYRKRFRIAVDLLILFFFAIKISWHHKILDIMVSNPFEAKLRMSEDIFFQKTQNNILSTSDKLHIKYVYYSMNTLDNKSYDI